ncbi:MAG: PglZ domain-containing protein, partial [Culicoidibacterales bacterium]
IDAIADKAATEHQTFAATETAIDELIQLIKMIQQAGTERILLTADHGYLYVSQAMKTEKVEWLGPESREQNSRFKLFEATTPLEYQYGTTMIQTPETPLTNVKAVMPTALRRFSAGKGAHFFHGGCSLQERIVPVVMIDSKNDTTQLTIEIDSNNKVTQYQPKIRFYQRSLLGEKAPLVTRMYFQRDGKPISNIVYHDFQATKKAELAQVISFSLFEQAYPIGSQFVLVVEIPTLQNTWQPYITKTYESFIQIQEK